MLALFPSPASMTLCALCPKSKEEKVVKVTDLDGEQSSELQTYLMCMSMYIYLMVTDMCWVHVWYGYYCIVV